MPGVYYRQRLHISDSYLSTPSISQKECAPLAASDEVPPTQTTTASTLLQPVSVDGEPLPEITPEMLSEMTPEELEAVYGEGWKSVVGCAVLGLATHILVGVACRILTSPSPAE